MGTSDIKREVIDNWVFLVKPNMEPTPTFLDWIQNPLRIECHYSASIAQWLEHWSCKPGVMSSILIRGSSFGFFALITGFKISAYQVVMLGKIGFQKFWLSSILLKSPALPQIWILQVIILLTVSLPVHTWVQIQILSTRFRPERGQRSAFISIDSSRCLAN